MLRARQNGGGSVRKGNGRGNGNGSPGGRGNNSGSSQTAQTWDPANKSAGTTLSNGNKTANLASGSPIWALSTGTKTSGKWYFEVLVGTFGSSFNYVGVAKSDVNVNSATPDASNSMSMRSNGTWNPGGGVSGSSYTAGDVLGFAVDMSTRVVTCYKNNVANGTSPVYDAALATIRIHAMNSFSPGAGNTYTIRTTTAEFSYSPPTGYLPWGTV